MFFHISIEQFIGFRREIGPNIRFENVEQLGSLLVKPFSFAVVYDASNINAITLLMILHQRDYDVLPKSLGNSFKEMSFS